MNGFDIVKPARCRVMTDEEMEYDGGFINFGIAAVCSIASVACTVMSVVDKENSEKWERAGLALGVTGTIFSFGVGTVVAHVARKATVSTLRRVAVTAGGRAGQQAASGSMSVGTYKGYQVAYFMEVTAPCLAVKGACYAYRMR